MPLHVNILRHHSTDCTNNGRSKFAKGVCIVNADGPFEPNDDYPAARIEKGPVGNPVVRFVDDKERGRGMNGGNFAYATDSRFGRAVLEITGYETFGAPVPIHDRYEG